VMGDGDRQALGGAGVDCDGCHGLMALEPY
jgi:hypothetical protein